MGSESHVKPGRIPEFKKRFGSLAKEFSSTQAFADFLGMSRPTVGFWLNGDRVPDAENLLLISEKTGKSIDWLLGIDPMERQTADKELRFVSDYTGLSESAVRILNMLCRGGKGQETNRKAILDTVSFLLEKPSFYRMVIDETRYAVYCDKRRNEWDGSMDYADLSEEELNAVDSLRAKQYSVLDASEMVDYQCIRAARAFSDFLDQTLLTHLEEIDNIGIYSLQNDMWFRDSLGIEEE